MAPPLSDGTNRSTVEAAPTLATSVPDASLPPSKAALLPEFAKLSTSDPSVPITKRIAIVGGGTAGIGQLIALTSLPESVRKGWQIDLFEQREDVGGVWLEEVDTPVYPALPKTPLYADLHTNTAAPTMTYPNHHFPAGTELFPSYKALTNYLRSSVDHFNLSSYIHLNHTLESATYSTTDKSWALDIKSGSSVKTSQYDHLVVASGRYHHPSFPEWKGQEEWIAAGGGQRELLHSLWFRGAEKYAGRTVVVVGFSASGWDMATLSSQHAKRVYHSYHDDPDAPFRFAPLQDVVKKPRISHFTADTIVFTDGSVLEEKDVVILLGTGFSLLAPFLTKLTVGPHEAAPNSLTTNKRYVRPLHQDIFSLDPSLPTNALAFSGLVWYIGVAQNSIAQGLFIAHTLADDNFLPSREELLKELAEYEEDQRAKGFDPFDGGHRFTAPGDAEAYQNKLVNIVRERSKYPIPSYLIAPDAEEYVQEWRRWGRGKGLTLRKGWKRAKAYGVEQRFIPSDGSEETWTAIMLDLLKWEEEQDLIEPWESTREK